MITIHQIAKKVKLSASTVSRALHNPTFVKPKTREKILKIAKKYNYICNLNAQALTTRKANILGVVLPTIAHSVFALSTKGIQDYAEERGYQIIFGNTDYQPEKQQHLISVFRGRGVDGIILNGTFINKDDIQKLKEGEIPFVITWEEKDKRGLNIVSFHDFKSAYKATEYLVNLGHRKIALLSGPMNLSKRALEKWKGYKACLAEKGIPYASALVVEKDHTLSSGREAMQELLQNKPTAVLCGTDTLAIGAIKAINDAALRVPRDISVMGYNDSEYAGYSHPPLTTVRVPAYELGVLCSRILIDLIEQNVKGPQRYILETELVIRKSCSPPREA